MNNRASAYTAAVPRGWRLQQARDRAAKIVRGPDSAARVKSLVREFFSPDSETRQHAADTARRLTESAAGVRLLQGTAERCIAACTAHLAEGTGEDWRTRSHLLLAAARVARTPMERRQVFHLALSQLQEPGGVLRACALEAVGLLGAKDQSLQAEAENVLAKALPTGTPAMRVRARDGLAAMESQRTRKQPTGTRPSGT